MLTRFIILGIIIAIAATLVFLLRLFKEPIRKWAIGLKARLKIQSLKKAIAEADAITIKTGRKAIVVFNRHTNEYEAIEKKLLKMVANGNKNKNNAAKTSGVARVAKPVKPRVFTSERVKLIEKKSLYVSR